MTFSQSLCVTFCEDDFMKCGKEDGASGLNLVPSGPLRPGAARPPVLAPGGGTLRR
jgi:hypothetical protein